MSTGKTISEEVRDRLNKNGFQIEKKSEKDYIKPLQTLYQNKYHKHNKEKAK